MKKFILPLALLTMAFTASKELYAPVEQNSFTIGEKLTYKAHFGFFSVGEASMLIQDKLHQVNDRTCYKVDVFGKTSGFVSWLAKVDDQWGGYIDTAALVPHISYRNIKEGNYRKNELVTFDHSKALIEKKVIDKKTGKYKTPEYYPAPTNIRDMMAGYLYVRAIDYSKMQKGDMFEIKAFFEDTIYDMKIRYGGKEKIKVKAGKFKAIKLEPMMPDNKLFDGKESILIWISDDDNKVPLKIQAKMFIGNAGIELENYDNLRNEMKSKL